MSQAHLNLLRKEMEKSKWVVSSEQSIDYSYSWKITRPNGDCPLTIKFFIGGNGVYGELLGDETTENSIGCYVNERPEISIYFGKFTGQFKIDLVEFMEKLNQFD